MAAPQFFNYDNDIKDVLLSASLQAPGGVLVSYGAGMEYGPSNNSSASLFTDLKPVTASTSSLPATGFTVNSLNKLTYNSSSGAINIEEGIVDITLTIQGEVVDVSELPATFYLSSSKGTSLIYQELTSASFTGSFTATLDASTDYYLYYSNNPSSSITFDFQFNITSSVYGRSYSGDVINLQADNIVLKKQPTILFYLPSDSYLEKGTELSASIVSVLDTWNGFNVKSGSLYTQAVLSPGASEGLPCDIVSCYFGETGIPTSWGGNTYIAPGFSPANRNQFRPIKGGISITSTSHTGPFAAASVGTLGLICQDVDTDAVVGLTNNHVVVRDAFYTNQRDLTGVIQNEFDLVDGYDPLTGNYSGLGDTLAYWENVFQSGEAPIATLSNRIGRVVRYVPMWTSASTAVNSSLTNRVDGAILSLYCTSSTGPIIDFTSSFQQQGLTYTSSMPFATTTEIDSLPSTNPDLYSSGRTTGVKGPLSCTLKFHSFANTPVAYNLQGTQTPAYFQDLIVFVKPENPATWTPSGSIGGASGGVCPYPVWGGDSGSTLIANFGGTWKIIGLVFAGNGVRYNGANVQIPSTYGLACRIDHVAAELGIKAWTGSIAPVVDHNNINYITVSGSNDIDQLNCSGSTYWQVGLTRTHNIC
jgi:hypothetical protein